MHRPLIILLALLLVGVGLAQPTREPLGPVAVRSVLDGDTVVLVSNVGPRVVRLIGIDTPEVAHPDRGMEPFGPEASDFTKTLLPPGTMLWVELDRHEQDAYGRLLAYLYRADPHGPFRIGGQRVQMVNLEIAAAGWARTLNIPPNDLYADLFSQAVDAARAAGIGMWSSEPPPARTAVANAAPSAPVADAERAEAPLRLTCVLYQPSEGLQETVFIEVLEPFDTRGYHLFDAGSGVQLRLPPGVQPVGELEVINLGRDIWNNSGDTIYLRDVNDRIVDAWQYRALSEAIGRTLCRDGSIR